jgi:hypothetical protein
MKVQFYADEDNGAKPLTLGQFASVLEQAKWNGIIMIPFSITKPHSYRGYYEQMAFEIFYTPQPIEDAISMVRSAIGNRYDGYKGGTFLMTDETLCHFSMYGTSSGSPVSTDVLNALAILQKVS